MSCEVLVYCQQTYQNKSTHQASEWLISGSNTHSIIIIIFIIKELVMLQHNLCFCTLFICGGPCHLSTINSVLGPYFSSENSLFIHIWKECKSVSSPVLYCKYQKFRVWISSLKLQTAPLSTSVEVLSAKYQNKSTPAAEWLLSGITI